MIEVNNVSMHFRMANDKVMSLKEYFVKRLTGKLKYSEFYALRDVSFTIKKGEVVGLIGGNGAGKSTLLKIISGILTPTKGNVKVSGNIAPMLELGAGFDFDLTARENIFLNGAILGYSKKFLMEKYEEIADFSELKDFMDVPVRNFSSGMTMRLAFSIATLVNPDILIVDEILSVGDVHFQKKSMERMRQLIKGGATVILVSHSIGQIRELCSKAIWLNKGQLMMIGDTTEVCNAYLKHSKRQYELNVAWKEEWNEYKRRLYSPTHITKIGRDYFIVDCWHHRVLHHSNLKDPIEKWNELDVELNSPHSIVSDGEVYLVEDSGNDSVRVLRRLGDTFVELQRINHVGRQPHKLIYDEKNKKFYGIAASSQQVFVLSNVGNDVVLEKNVKLDFLKTSYVRSISLIDGSLYFVSGPGKVIEARVDDLSFELINEYPVPFEFQGMNDIAKIGDYYYISVYQDGAEGIQPRLIRVKDLNHIENYEDMMEKIGIKGVPYYFSFIDDRVFITEIDTNSAIKSFTISGENEVQDILTHFDFGAPIEASRRRRDAV